MKMKIIATAISVGLGLCLAQAATARTIFEGRLVITAVQNCADSQVGDRLTSLYHVANLGGNSNRTSLTAVRDLNAEGYQLGGGRFTAAFKNVDAVETGSGAHSFISQVRIISSSPPTANLTATTNFVTLTGQIKNRRDDPDGLSCIVTFRAAYTRRLEN